MEFGEEVRDVEDVLMFLPGKTAEEIWVIIAYRNEQSFQRRDLYRRDLLKARKRGVY